MPVGHCLRTCGKRASGVIEAMVEEEWTGVVMMVGVAYSELNFVMTEASSCHCQPCHVSSLVLKDVLHGHSKSLV